MGKLQIVIGSTRPDRAADRVAWWVIDRVRSHGEFDVEVLDLRDWQLPMFAETIASVGDFANPTFSDPIVKRWNTKIIPAVGAAFTDDGAAADPLADASLTVVLDNLAWWIGVLNGARHSQLAPGRFRARQIAARST